MEEITMNRIELLPDRWRPQDPRCPPDDLPVHIFFVGMTREDLRQYATEDSDMKDSASHAWEYLDQWTPLKIAKAFKDAAFKIESLTVKSESERRN